MATTTTTTTNHHFGKILVLPILFICMFLQVDSKAQSSALGTCSGQTVSEKYAIEVEGLIIGDYYEIYLDTNGTPFLDTTILINTNATVISPSQLDFIDGTKSVNVRVIHDALPLLIGANDTTDYVVHEVLCIDADKDGTMDFDTATCDYTMALPDIGSIVSTVHPYNGPNVYLYVLTDSAGIVLDTIENYKGHFTDLANGEYEVHAYNFLNTSEASSFMDSLTLGVTDIDGFNVSFPSCYNWCGTASYTVSCDCIINIDTDPVDLVVCPQSDGDFFVATSVGPPIPPGATLEYKWQVDDQLGGGFVDQGDVDSVLNLTNLTFSDSGFMYRVIVTLDVGGTDICMDTSAVATLHVYDDPVLASDLDNMVCSDEAAGIVLSVETGSVAADSFDIVSIDVNGLTPAGGNAGTGRTADVNIIAADSYNNVSSAEDTVFYSIAPMSANGCVGDTAIVSLIVKPEPVYASEIVTTVCSGDSIMINLPSLADNSIVIDSYYVVLETLPAAITTGSANSGPTTDAALIFNDYFMNLSDDTDTVRYSVAPFSGGCLGDTIRIKIAVKPEPVFASDIPETVCSDFETGVMLPIGDDTGLAISAYDIDTIYVGPGLAVVKSTVGLNMTTFDTLASDIYTNLGFAEDSVIYQVTPYSDGCQGEPFNIVLTVTPEPVGSDPAPIVCSDEALSVNLHTIITNGMDIDSFSWQAEDNVNVTGETLSASNDTIIADALNNVTSTDQVVLYKVIPYSGGCIGDTITITVTVNPEPVETSYELIVCSDEASGIVLPDSSDNMLDIDSFTIASVKGAALTGTSFNGSGVTDLNQLANEVFNNITGAEDTVIYTITPYSGGCVGDDYEITLIVRPEPVLDSPNLDVTVCSGSPTGVTLAVTGTSVSADSFNIVSIDSAGVPSLGGSPVTGMTGDISEIADDAWSNIGGAPVTVTYHVSPVSADGCVGDTLTIVITIDPEVLVDAGTAAGPLCSNSTLDLSTLGATISGGTTDGTWTTDGDGGFDNSGNFLTSTTYTPGTNDILNGSVTLTLESLDPAGECTAVSDTVVITINDVECSQFPWNGND